MAHYRPTRKDMNAIDDPQHPPKPLPAAHPLRRIPANGIPMRPRGAGSEVRRDNPWLEVDAITRINLDKPPFGITEENAPRVLRAIYEDEDGAARGPHNVGKALAIIAVLTAGALVLVVALPYLWAKVVGL